MEIKLTEKQFRRLLDLVYIGNWVLNSTRGDDRIRDYDKVESLIFSHCLSHGMAPLVELYQGELIPSRAFADGGIPRPPEIITFTTGAMYVQINAGSNGGAGQTVTMGEASAQALEVPAGTEAVAQNDGNDPDEEGAAPSAKGTFPVFAILGGLGLLGIIALLISDSSEVQSK